jgi:pantetheine-phosphate adenylyltransferase
MRIGVYPGSFDPLTYGHLDIIERAVRLCDKLIVAVAYNSAKEALFTVNERIDLIENCCNGKFDNLEVVSFSGLLAEYCNRNKISFIVRGLRSVTDFDYEMSIAFANRRLAANTETIFLMTREENSFISSQIVREIASYHGDISSLVPQFVQKKIQEKFSTVKN